MPFSPEQRAREQQRIKDKLVMAESRERLASTLKGKKREQMLESARMCREDAAALAVELSENL